MFLTHEQLMDQCEQTNKSLTANRLHLVMEGVEIDIKNTLGLRTFRKYGTTCACCGNQAVGYMLEKHIVNPKSKKKRRVIPILVLFGYRKNGTKVRFTTDHIIPKSRGGNKTGLNNLQTMCIDCNKAKGNLLPSEEVLGRNWWKKIPTDQFETEPNLYDVA
jgi:hypothetical protein